VEGVVVENWITFGRLSGGEKQEWRQQYKKENRFLEEYIMEDIVNVTTLIFDN
jgi:hypothetical protein